MNPDLWLKHRAKVSASRIVLKEATSTNQGVYKAAKSDGVHIDAMKLVMSLEAKDALEAAAFMRAVLEGALIQKCAFMHQGDMLNGGSIADMLKVSAATPAMVEKFDYQMALERGHKEGLEGGSLDNLAAEFGAGTPSLQAATKGFAQGKKFMEGNQPEGLRPVSGGKGRRGGRAKAEETSEPEPDGRIEASNQTEMTIQAMASEVVDMVKVQSMTNPEMAAYWSKVTGQPCPRFESRAVGIQKLSALYAAQQPSDAHASN
jgi:hypothetical protein